MLKRDRSESEQIGDSEVLLEVETENLLRCRLEAPVGSPVSLPSGSQSRQRRKLSVSVSESVQPAKRRLNKSEDAPLLQD